MLPPSILNDNISGSSVIAAKVAEWIKSEIFYDRHFNYSRLVNEFNKLHKVFPHFAVLHHFADTVLDFLNHLHRNPDKVISMEVLQHFLDYYNFKWIEHQKEAVRKMISEIGIEKKRLLLHSHSGSLIILFEILKCESIKPLIVQTVSEPGKEGIIQARRLSEMGFEVMLIHEAACSRLMNELDFFISGADAIYRNFVINKTGTFPLALLCKHFNKPYYILADERKMVVNSKHSLINLTDFSETPKPGKEILENPPERIKPVNYYFEPVPIGLVEKIFTNQ